MFKFYSAKMSQYLLLIVFTITLNFFLPRLMPGSPLRFLGGEDVILMTTEEKELILEKHGLDKPVHEQYFMYIRSLLKGDIGYSYQQKMPVMDIIKSRLPWTLILTGLNLIITTILGITLGTIAAWKRGSKQDIALINVFAFLKSMPSFWIGMILVSIFGAQLGVLPIYGAYTMWGNYTGLARIIDIAKHLVLPVTTLVFLSISSIFLTMRYSMIDVLGEDYIFMAKVKGLDEGTIKYKHAMRNALIPVVTIVMLNLGYMVGGATVVETVFSYPGIGRMMFEAVINRDYPVLQAGFLIITISVILANFIADMIYPLFDPKVV
ncbi:ABC transporter permease [Wukongibacter baidiensis]|uniref:ABC transporter permease n=1 Tax=Wukongibacter baidiensis TaxID=1723361 RepID=UPI003D7FC623